MEEEAKTLKVRRFMKEMEKQLKMDLLEKLMSEMEDHSIKRLKKSEPKVEVTELEQKEMPLSELKEMMTDKMSADEPVEESEEDEEDKEGEENTGDFSIDEKAKQIYLTERGQVRIEEISILEINTII